MRSPNLAPGLEIPVHVVRCDFGRQGLAYKETSSDDGADGSPKHVGERVRQAVTGGRL